MARGVGALNVSVNADTGKAVRGIGDLRGALGGLPASTSLAAGGMSSMAAAASVAAAGVAAAAAVVSVAIGQLDELGTLYDSTQKIGIAADQLQGLRMAGEEAGVSAATMDKSLVKMLRSTAEVAGGTGAAADAFSALGLSAQSMISMAPEEQFRLIAERMQDIPTSAEKLDVAMSIFGKSGADMVTVLGLGRDGLDEVQAAAEKLGITLTNEQVAAADAAGDAIGRIGMAADGAKNALAVALAPAIETTANALTALITGFGPSAWDFSGIDAATLALQEQEAQQERLAAAARVQAEAEREVTKEFEKQLAALKDKTAMQLDPAQAQYDKDVKQFGEGRAFALQEERDRAEGIAYQQEKEKAALAEEERKKKDDEREKEKKARDAERKHLETVKRENAEVAKLRDRIKDFGKSDLEKERSQVLRGISDPAKFEEARAHFRTLAAMEKGKAELDRLKDDRSTLAGRSAQDTSMLDARSAEGWAALRESAQNPQLIKLDRQIQLLEEANSLASKTAKEEVFKL